MFEFKPEKPIPSQFQPTSWPKGRLTELLGDARKNGENALKADSPKADAKDAKPQNKPDVQAKAEQPAQETKQNQKPDAQMDALDDGDQPQAKEPSELKHAALKPTPDFTPTVAPGVLSILVNQKANAVPHDDISEYKQGDEFKLGKGGYGLKKRLEDERREQYEDGYGSNSSKSERALQQYAQMQLQQQQQAFARTTEYSVALSTTQEAIRNQQAKIDQARLEYEALKKEKIENQTETAEAAEVVATTGAALEKQDQHVAGVKDTMGIKAQHDQNVAAVMEADTDLNQAENMRQEVVNSTIQATFYGNDAYYELKENGVDVAYKVGPDGIAHKMDPKDISDEVRCQMPIPLSIETNAGKRTIIGAYEKTLPPEQAEKVKEFLKNQNKDVTDLAGSNDMANANMDVSYRRDKVIDALSAAEITEAQLKEAQQKYNIPDAAMKDMKTLSAYHDEQLKKAAELHTQHDAAIKAYDESVAKGGAIDEAMEEKKAEIAGYEEESIKFKEFEKRLANKEFANEEAMLKAMPADLRDRYKQNVAIAKAEATVQPAKEASAEKSQTASADNKSRPVGSAASSEIATSTKDVTSQYNNAAAGTTAPANEPAPTAEQEMIYANSAPKTTAGGIHP